MKKTILALTLCSILGSAAMAKCVCFELEGKFGEEIMAILQKYAKNLGDENITVVKEEKIKPEDQKSFVASLIGVIDSPDSVTGNGDNDLAAGKAFYNKQCATCHGENGQEKAYGTSRPIAGMDAQKVYADLKHYQDGTYAGGVRFVKQTIAQTMTDPIMRSVAEYVSKLKDTPAPTPSK